MANNGINLILGIFDLLRLNPFAVLPQQVTEYNEQGKALHPFKGGYD